MFLSLQHKYSKSLSWAENLNKLLTVLAGKFKFSAQDSDLEYLCWRCKNSPESSGLKPQVKPHMSTYVQKILWQIYYKLDFHLIMNHNVPTNKCYK